MHKGACWRPAEAYGGLLEVWRGLLEDYGGLLESFKIGVQSMKLKKSQMNYRRDRRSRPSFGQKHFLELKTHHSLLQIGVSGGAIR